MNNILPIAIWSAAISHFPLSWSKSNKKHSSQNQKFCCALNDFVLMGSNCQNLRMAAPDAPPLDRWRFRSVPPPLSIPFCLPRASRSVGTLSHQRDPSTPKVTLFQQPFLPQSLIALKNKLHQSIRQMFIYPTVCEFYPSTN